MRRRKPKFRVGQIAVLVHDNNPVRISSVHVRGGGYKYMASDWSFYLDEAALRPQTAKESRYAAKKA